VASLRHQVILDTVTGSFTTTFSLTLTSVDFFRMGNEISISQRPEILSRRQTDPTDQICESRVMTQPIEPWLDVQKSQTPGSVRISLVQPIEGLIVLPQTGIEDRHFMWRALQLL